MPKEKTQGSSHTVRSIGKYIYIHIHIYIYILIGKEERLEFWIENKVVENEKGTPPRNSNKKGEMNLEGERTEIEETPHFQDDETKEKRKEESMEVPLMGCLGSTASPSSHLINKLAQIKEQNIENIEQFPIPPILSPSTSKANKQPAIQEEEFKKPISGRKASMLGSVDIIQKAYLGCIIYIYYYYYYYY